jgi:hypothetical protein
MGHFTLSLWLSVHKAQEGNFFSPESLGLAFASQVLCCLSHSPSPFVYSLFFEMGSHLSLPELALNSQSTCLQNTWYYRHVPPCPTQEGNLIGGVTVGQGGEGRGL